MPQIKDTEYLQISARIRVMENRLLGRERSERMIEAKTVSDALRVLTECGYPDSVETDFEAALAQERARVFDDLYKSAPVSEIIDFFRIRFDYHNLKTMIKSEALGIDGKRLLSESGRITVKRIKDAFDLNQLNLLPEDMAEAAADAREVLASTGDPQLCDLSLDRSCYDEMLWTAEKSGSSFLLGYYRLMADCANLKSLVRIRRLNKGSELFRSALVAGGNVSDESIRSQALSGANAESIFAGTALEAAAAAGEAESLTAFERECDNALVRYLNGAKLIPFGDAVMVAYAAAKEAEMTAVRIIIAGKKAGLSGDEIRERLRDSYV